MGIVDCGEGAIRARDGKVSWSRRGVGRN